MSRIFILAFVLFATLFAVNAAPLELEKRETQFTPCPDLPPDAVGLDIKMTPDPVVLGAVETFDIKGTMKKDIIAGDWLGIAFIDLAKQLPIEYPLTLDICTLPGVTCPITAGTVFSTTQEYTAPDELPAKYTIAVAIGRGIPPEKIVPIACSAASIGGSELSAGLDLWDFL